MFCNLDADALAAFETIGVQATLPRGAKLFQEDTPSSGVFVICTGHVKLLSTSKEGRTLILKIAMPGDVLGHSGGGTYSDRGSATTGCSSAIGPEISVIEFFSPRLDGRFSGI
jgi:CRP-like cAMP-binding protein